MCDNCRERGLCKRKISKKLRSISIEKRNNKRIRKAYIGEIQQKNVMCTDYCDMVFIHIMSVLWAGWCDIHGQ